ncbi:MAG: RNA polymerase sigma factor [Burkholderiales bacterium]|nr:RNA polymerase sigma factor [Burkholderiales bacterium]
MNNWYGIDLGWAYAELFASIRHKTHCVHRSYDVLHDSLIRFAAINQSRNVEQPHAYLRRIVGNILVDQYREARHWVSMDDADNHNSSENPEWEEYLVPSAEHLAELNRRLTSLQRVLDCLPPRCREVFWFFRVEGYSQPETARRLGVSLKAIEYQVARALVDMQAASELLM